MTQTIKDGPCGSPFTAAESESLVQWRGPRCYTLLSFELDFLRGGASRLCVRSPEGRDYWLDGVNLEIAEPERMVFSGNLEVAGERLPETGGTVTFRRA
jgi:uncharacterized protein YndB with AHSA1/START domain